MPVTVEGLEIACVGDKTEHSLPLGPGPGAVNVTVNGKPVWRVKLDNHVCPQFDGPKPHVGGKVQQGAKKTRVCGGYVARKTDKVVEALGPDPIAPGATAAKSAAAGGLQNLLSEIPGVSDVVNEIAPDLMQEMDDMLGGELSKMLADMEDCLKSFLPDTGSMGNFPGMSLMKELWKDRDVLRELYALKDKSPTEMLAWLAGAGFNGEIEDIAHKLEGATLGIYDVATAVPGYIVEYFSSFLGSKIVDTYPPTVPTCGPGGLSGDLIHYIGDWLAGDHNSGGWSASAPALYCADHDNWYAEGGTESDRLNADRSLRDITLTELTHQNDPEWQKNNPVYAVFAHLYGDVMYMVYRAVGPKFFSYYGKRLTQDEIHLTAYLETQNERDTVTYQALKEEEARRNGSSLTPEERNKAQALIDQKARELKAAYDKSHWHVGYHRDE